MSNGMRRIGAALAFVPMALLLASSAEGRPHGVVHPCPPGGAGVLLADHRAVVYRIHAKRIRSLGRTHYREPVIATRGCAYGSERPYQIWEEPAEFQTEEHAGIANLALAGIFLAYEESFDAASRYTVEGTEVRERWHVVVCNLQTGMVLHRVPTGASGRPLWVGDGPTVAIVVKRNGSVAWLLEHVAAVNPRYELHVLDTSGERVVAAGSDIDPRSVALAGSTLYWTQGATPRSTTVN
jgi:hypothetical protein